MTDAMAQALEDIDVAERTMLCTITEAIADFEDATGCVVTKLRRREGAVSCRIVVRSSFAARAADEDDAPEVVPPWACPECRHARTWFDAVTGQCRKYAVPEGAPRPTMCGCACPPAETPNAVERSGGA